MLTKRVRNEENTPIPTVKPVSDAVVTALTYMSPTAIDAEVACLFEHGFTWFSEANRQEAVRHVQAAAIACDHNLTQQLVLHVRQAQTITLRDLADRVQAVVARKLDYVGPLHFYQHPVSGPFIIRTDDERYSRYEWHYARIDEFDRLIPPKALATLAYLEKLGLRPQAYWVADKRQQATLRSIDPILSSQFGPWFVAIAEWV
ncbi:MAG: hypothetical protein IT328_23375 [Caldilineaceae bacterium]|nr:hypothetical protein [Caldilineaceae bacterium]